MDLGGIKPDFSACAEVANECIALRLRKAARVVSRFYDRILKQTGLNGNQFSLLVAIHLSEPVRVSDLVELLLVERTVALRNLTRIEEQRLITIVAGKDRRTRIVTLTSQGRRALSKALPRWRDAQARLSRALNEEQWGPFMRGLSRVTTFAGERL